ncbi:MAG: YezD family protein [Endomicrobiales bacterium]|jgi:hypothetical protein
MSGKVKTELTNEAVIKKISQAVSGISYGSITITVHDHKIVQIDKVEKIRVDQ